MTTKSIYAMFAAVFMVVYSMVGQTRQPCPARETLLMDFGWRFALGHASNTGKDFGNGSGYFSYFAKAGYGDGAAAKDFDDRGWRKLDLPHDWCVELPYHYG